MNDPQLDRLGEAVERKKRRAKAASERPRAEEPGTTATMSGDQRPLVEPGRPQDTRDERKKSAGHSKKTADKWNQ